MDKKEVTDKVSKLTMSFTSSLLTEIVTLILDSIEEFLDLLKIPTLKITRDSLFVCLGFLAVSIIGEFTDYSFIVSWQEALTAVILLGIIVCIDTSVRSKLVGSVLSVKGVAHTKIKNIKEASSIFKIKEDKNYGESGTESGIDEQHDDSGSING